MTTSEVALIVAVAVQGAGFCFWLGALSTKVKRLEEDLAKHDSLNDSVIRLEVSAEQTKDKLDNMARAMEGFSRQLANLMQRGIKGINEG